MFLEKGRHMHTDIQGVSNQPVGEGIVMDALVVFVRTGDIQNFVALFVGL